MPINLLKRNWRKRKYRREPEETVFEHEDVVEHEESESETAEASGTEAYIDDEILEIFVEEAQEVFEQIDIHWPIYAGDVSNQDALKRGA